MTSTLNVSNKISFRTYHVEILNREGSASYPNHKFSVLAKRDTPKGKYSSFKVEFHYVYQTYEAALKAATIWIDRIKTNTLKREEEAALRRAKNAEVKASDYYKEGDIIVNSWGYEQTNVYFYQVTKVGNKTIEIKQIHGSIVENSEYSHGMACEVEAVKDSFMEDGDTYQLRVKDKGQLSNPETYYYMHKWDGRPKYKSWYY